MRFSRLLIAAGIGAAFLPQAQPPALDLVIQRGTIIDGSGRPRFTGDVGIINGRIAAIGNLASRRATASIDARGLIVTPGFINLHSHATPDGLRVAENMLTQGVTTEILNADGAGPLDIATQLRMLDSSGLAINAGANVGFNAVWSNVVGQADRRPTADEIERMRQIITGNLEEGAFSVSAGLDYKPGYYATEDEVVRVLEPARKWRTNFPNHDRVTPETKFSARAAVQETMRIGERSGLVPVVTHMKVSGREKGSASVILGQMRALSARGVYTAADVYPYLSGLTGLGALTIPAWAVDGGPIEMRKRFSDPALRKRIIAETDETIAARFTGADGILVLSTRRTLSDYMKEFATSSPGEAIVRIMETDSPRAILGFGREDDLKKILQYPAAAVSCDCGATVEPTGHPRNYGTFPRVLGRYVREQKVLTLEDAIRKMTALPATISGFTDRGYLAVGMAADLAIFDAAKVIDHATFDQPGLKSAGMVHVLVNGQVALRDGLVTGTKAGRTLRRQSWMPSRPMSGTGTTRRFAARGRFTPLGAAAPTHDVVVSLVQPAGARYATGTFTSTQLDDSTVIKGVSYGVIQSARGWTSVTGRSVHAPSSEERSFTLTVDEADPTAASPGRLVTFEIDDAPPVRGVLVGRQAGTRGGGR